WYTSWRDLAPFVAWIGILSMAKIGILYLTIYNIIPHIGKIKLNKLTTLDLQQFYNKVKEGGRVQRYEGMQDLSLSNKTVRGLHAMLRQCLEQAVKERLIPYNPATGCRLPPKEKKEMQVIPPEKIGDYLRAAEEHGVLPMFYLELTTGLRRGELVALLWSDLNVKEQTLSISKSAGRINGEVKVSQPKTANSVRTIYLPKETVDLLVEEHRKHIFNKYMFPSPVTGGMYGPDCVGRLHKTLLKKAGITEKVRFHDLRHTFATLAIQSGVDAKTVSSILGHYSAGFTLDTYTHVTGDMQKEAAKRVGSLIAQAV
ncbi:MAG: site-specific integrase, partial [Lawsonibacter sp.]|nr:site-specific integrase [Lawsonibacter sp.]